jgi:hypothetical protein
MIDESDQTQLLYYSNEFAAGDEASFHVTHAQQAFKIIYFPRFRAHHRLERKEQSILA